MKKDLSNSKYIEDTHKHNYENRHWKFSFSKGGKL